MARKQISGGELPCLEERRRILQRAGVVLNAARALVARLDVQESAFPRSGREQEQVLDRMKQSLRRIPFSASVRRVQGHSPGPPAAPSPG